MINYNSKEMLYIYKNVPNGAFRNSQYKLVVLSNKVEKIGDYAFSDSAIEMMIVNSDLIISKNAFNNTPLKNNDYNNLLCTNQNPRDFESSNSEDIYSPYLPISQMQLTVRSLSCLNRSKYANKSLKDLYDVNLYDLLQIRNMGRKSAKEVFDYITTSKERNNNIVQKQEFNKVTRIIFKDEVIVENDTDNIFQCLDKLSYHEESIVVEKEKSKNNDDVYLYDIDLSTETISVLKTIGFYNKKISELKKIDKNKIEKLKAFNEEAYNEIINIIGGISDVN